MFCCKSKSDQSLLKNVIDPEKIDCFSFKGQSFVGIPTNVYDITGIDVLFKCQHFDKYRKLLVDIWNLVVSQSINYIMVAQGHW